MFDPLNKEYSDDEDNENNNDLHFKIDSEIIFEAWLRYRPKTNAYRINGLQNNDLSSPEAQSLSGKSNFSQNADNIQNYTKAMTSKKKRKTFLESFPLDQIEQSILDEEKKIVKEFLSKFIASPEISMSNLIDVSWVLKALPTFFHIHNVVKSNLINMRNLQLSLIAYQNESQDKLFQFYDTRIETRMQILAKRAEENKEIIQDIKMYSNSLHSRISRIKNNRDSTKKKRIPFHLDTEPDEQGSKSM
jgi:hypothetical protein